MFRKNLFILLLIAAMLLCSCSLTSHSSLEDTPISSPSDIVTEPVNNDISSDISSELQTDASNDQSASNETSDDFSTEETEKPVSTSKTISLCLLGDIMCLSGQQHLAALSDGTHDYTGNYRLIASYFESSDYVVGNLETCLASGSPYSTKEKTIDGNPNCNAPADLLDSLKAVGMDVLITANNHCLDAGTKGIYETLDNLDNKGFLHTGTHTPDTAEEKHYVILDQNGIKIAIIAVTELINRRSALNDEPVASYVDEFNREFISEQITLARDDDADYVIVYEHWGSENTSSLRSYQKEHALYIAEAGADLIIGSHSHCIQPMEVLETSDGRAVACYYSLGNLVSSMEREINHDALLILLKLDFNNNKINADITEVPCHVIKKLEGCSLVITPVDYETSETSVLNTLAAAATRIRQVLDGTYIEPTPTTIPEPSPTPTTVQEPSPSLTSAPEPTPLITAVPEQPLTPITVPEPAQNEDYESESDTPATSTDLES